MAEGRKAVDFDKVLKTSFIAELAGELTRLAKERQRASLTQKVRDQLTKAEAEIKTAETAANTAEERISMLNEVLIDHRREQSQLQARRENLRSGASSAEREELERKRDKLNEQLSDLTAEICDRLPGVAPMVANRGLVVAALTELDERLKTGGSGEESIVHRIKEALPTWLKEGPPRLDPEKRTRLTGTLIARLDRLVDRAPPTGLFADLDPERAVRIRDALLGFVGLDQRRAHYQLLATTHRTRLELLQASESLMELEVGSEATVAEYRTITTQLERAQDEIDRVNQEIGQQKRQLRDAREMLDRKQKEVMRLDKESKREGAKTQELNYIRRLTRSLNDLREAVREEMRQRVMELINEKFRILVHDQQLIQTIELDDTYTMTFKDWQDRPIGRSKPFQRNQAVGRDGFAMGDEGGAGT